MSLLSLNNFIVANAVEKAMVPYFGQIMEHLKVYLTGQLTTEEMALQTQALGRPNYFFFINYNRLIFKNYYLNLNFFYSIYLFDMCYTSFNFKLIIALRHFGCHCSDDWRRNLQAIRWRVPTFYSKPHQGQGGSWSPEMRLRYNLIFFFIFNFLTF